MVSKGDEGRNGGGENNRHAGEISRTDMSEGAISKGGRRPAPGEKAQKIETGPGSREAGARRTLPKVIGSAGETEGLTEE